MNEVRDASNQEQMIQTQIIDGGIRDERVLAALRAVPRDRFFLEEARNIAFANKAAPIGHGQTISQPYIVALMTEKLDVRADQKVLEIGTGSGYQTAILSKLAREVFTVERIKPLLDGAWDRLMGMGIRNVHYRFGDGTLGWPEEGPFDRILITAGAPKIPEELLKSQLANGGIAVLPVDAVSRDESWHMSKETQMLVEVRRDGDQLQIKDICACRFVKLIGKEGWDEGKERE